MIFAKCSSILFMRKQYKKVFKILYLQYLSPQMAMKQYTVLLVHADWLQLRGAYPSAKFTSEPPKKNKMAFVGILSQIKLLFGNY